MSFDPLLFLFLMGASLFLVVDHIYLAAPVLVALSGIFFRLWSAERTAMPEAMTRSWRAMLLGFASFSLSVIFLNFYHGDLAARNFERMLPFLLLPAIAWTIRARSWDVRHWFWAIGLGCHLCLAVAVWDTFFLLEPRAGGVANNVIIFGNISVVMGSISVVAAATLHPRDGSIWLRTFLLLGALCAVGASFLSGSKGGWLAIGIVAIIASALATAHLPVWNRLIAGLMSVVLVVSVGLIAPQHIVMDRIVSGLQGALTWFETGDVSEGSVSARLELWRLGLHLFLEAPIFGLGTGHLMLRWSELTSVGAPFAHLAGYTTTDNELIGALAGGGIVGALGTYAVYFGSLLAFWPWRNHQDGLVRCISTIGLVVVVAHLLFGLSTSVLGRSMFRAEFVTFTSSLFAFLSLRVTQDSVQSSAKGTSRVEADKG
jgi:O-antigen ligase